MRSGIKNIYVLFLTLTLIFVLTACGEYINKSNNSSAAGEPAATPVKTVELLDSSNHPVVTMEMSNGGVVKVELYPEVAPQTVANFVTLAKSGFYDSLIFHRVIPGFMIQGGDPQGTGTGGPGYSIKGEFTSNNFENLLLHKRGVISMARSKSPDSAGSQFFIMQQDAPHLNGDYAAFGEVIEGMETVDAIANQAVGANDKPVDPIYMVKVTVDEKGVELPELETIQ